MTGIGFATSILVPALSVFGQVEGNSKWVKGWQAQIDQKVRLMTEAYDLDGDMQAALRQELSVRLDDQRAFEQQRIPKLIEMSGKLKDMSKSELMKQTPEQAALMRSLHELSNTMPLNDHLVADWLDKRLPPETAQKGRRRFEELLHRQNQRTQMVDVDVERRAVVASSLRMNQLRKAQVSSGGKPLPPGQKLNAPAEAEKAIVHPQRKAVTESPNVEPKKTTKALPPIPPLDDWVKYTFEVDKRYKFTESQKAQAQSILADLYVRADHYLRSHPGAHEALKKTTSKTEYRRILKENKLDVTFDALFDELKQRLENLATSGQKSSAPKKAK